MNFLAHSMISFELEKNTPANTLFGNFAGDFYKGNIDNLAVASHIKDGVRLHRFIDSTTDRKENLLNPILAKEFGIFKGVVADIVIDHFIAKHFERLFQQELKQVETDILQKIQQNQPHFPQGFPPLFHWLSQNRALSRYAELDFLANRVFYGMSQRIKRGEILLSAVDVLNKHYSALESLAIEEFIYTREESIRRYVALKNGEIG